MDGKPPIAVAMDLTRWCNNRCLYCFAYPEPSALASGGMIVYDDACQLLRIVAREFSVSDVRFTGGEATLHPRLADLIRFANDVIRAPTLTLMSNGRRLRDPAYCQSLFDAGLNKLQISLESSDAAVHDRMVDVQGAWAETVAGIKTALCLRPDLGPRISLKMTISQFNRHTLSETIRFIADLGVRALSMNVCSAAGRGAEQPDAIPDLNDRVELLAQAQALARELGLAFESHFSFDLCVEDPTSAGLRHYACGRGRAYLALDYQGDLLVCHSWGKEGGNLLQAGSVRALWNADPLRYCWYGRHLPDRCRACPRLNDCGGVCPTFSETFGLGHVYEDNDGVLERSPAP